MKVSKRSTRGFTLIEILIVVVILGILAAIVIPQFSSASQEASISSVRSQLQTLRSQVELYRVQQGDFPEDGTIPGSGTAGTGGFAALVSEKYLQRLPEVPANWTLTLAGGDVTASYSGTDLPEEIDPATW